MNGFNFQIVNVPSGVPQGSHFGPLLFTIFNDDIIKCFKNAKFFLFSDDMNIFLPSNSIADCCRSGG